MYKVFIDGKEGTTGLKIFERFSCRKDIEILEIDDSKRKDPDERKKLINSSDITFLCLPDVAAKESVSLCDNPQVHIIDASTAHRTNPEWAYGFAELGERFRTAVINGKRIAVPGCHASGFVSLVYPLTECGMMTPDYPVTCFSLTGYSGGGKKMITEYQDTGRPAEFDSPRQYGVTQNHKHLPEMKYITGLSSEPVFLPTVCDFYSGMQVSIPVYPKLLKGNPSIDDIYNMFCEKYRNSKMVKVRPVVSEGFVASNDMAGRDDMEIIITGNNDRCVLISQFDNLGKGASGAAMQCMNIMLGLDDDFGLTIGD
ncbi:MAG: N-acetyl-gamma-glutamyl-phosphate reductase [Clostridia bacterium]|nr:N-acetyl-gamma-glutamyl-phosphate reductase [Clostridia bacterium]